MTWNDFSFVFLQECVSSHCEVGLMRNVKARICNASHHIHNIYWAVISLDRWQTKEITAEDILIQKIVRKGRKTHGSDCAWMFGIFDKSTRVCLTLSGHMLQQTQGLYCHLLSIVLLPVPYMTTPGTSTRLLLWEGIKAFFFFIFL